MSRFEFDCFVCDEHLKTNDLQAVVDFGKRHKSCGLDAPTEDAD